MYFLQSTDNFLFFILCILFFLQVPKLYYARELQSKSILKGSCSGEFEDWDPNSGFCYLIKDGLTSWQEAQDYCSSLGGNLPSIGSQEEQEAIQLKVEELGFNPWIGLKAKDSKSNFTWIDGTEFVENSYNYWAEGEPNFGNDGGEYCAYIGNNDGHWDDHRCQFQDQQHQLICKKKKTDEQDYILIKSDHECNSKDEDLGDFTSLEECANACKNMAGCKFFIYGKDTKQGWCYWEKTSDSSCPEGWEEDKYDFYELTSTPSKSYELLQQNAECGGHIRTTICEGDCSLPVNRELEGVANCFQLLQGNSECGNKWFEVGDNLCMCYKIELLQCDITSDANEDLYKIGEDEAMYWTDDGCPTSGTDVDGSWQSKSAPINVRCCTYDGTQCGTPYDCPDNKASYDDAVAKCAENNRRLCTKEELVGGVCCGNGGSCDSYSVWTSTPRSGEKYWVDDGCVNSTNDVDGSFQPKSYQACLRCCSNNGKNCSTPLECPADKMSYDHAVSKCAESDLRLCTKEELLSKVCCGTGGSCDSYEIWTSTQQSEPTTTAQPTEPPPPPAIPCNQESPDDGWVTAAPLPDFCYMKVEEAKSWQGSNDDCLAKGGHLLSVHSNEENTFVGSLLPDPAFWNGLIKTKKGGQRHWTDTSAYNYDHWKEGEPNDSGNGEDCTVMMGSNHDDMSGLWNDIVCSKTYAYICKKWKDGHEPTAPPPTEVPTGHCDDDGSTYEFEGHCYKFLTNPLSWSDAVRACEEQQVSIDKFQLASVHSERESAFIKTMYTYLPIENQNVIFWFGATDETNEGEWVYVDTSVFDYTHWEGDEPNNQGEEDCAELASGENNPAYWNDGPCDGAHGALCKTKVNPNNPNPVVLSTCMDLHSSFVSFNGACYKWMDVPKTWDEAKQDCINQHSNLVSIVNDMDQSYVFANAQQTQTWIGLSNKENKDIFKWSDGWDMTYTNWLNDQQVNGDEQCAYLDVERYTCNEACEYPDGNWLATACTDTRPYMCKFGDVPPDSLKCPTDDWIHYGPSCYKAYSYGYERSFTEARAFCQSQGGDLISVGSVEEETNVLKQIVDNYMVSNIFWIGLYRVMSATGESYEKDYAWVDESLKQYNHFADGYPDSRSGIEKCVMADNGYDHQADEDARLAWKNYNCDSRMEFVCEITAGYEPPTTAVPPTLPPQIPCNPETDGDGWIKFPEDQGGSDEFCYYFNIISPMGWLDAQDNCMQQGGRLASVHSTQENSFLMHNLASNDIGWIGFLKDAPTDQFMWTDGSPADFLAWGPGEPNDADDMESCTHLVTQTGTWNDENCYANHNFVCKKPSDGTWPTPSPTTIPEGHCRADFSEYQGYCYKMMGIEGDDSKKDWRGAKDACANFAAGAVYDLASMHNPREAAFVTTMLADLPGEQFISFWIGATEGASTEGLWWWSDESRWDYTNWAQGQPDDWNSPYDCGIILDRDVGNDVGKWDDTDCYGYHGYICKTQASIEHNAPPNPPHCDDQPEIAQYKFTKFNGNCYKYQSTKVSWQDAENACKEMGGSHLVSINDGMEEAFVYTRIKTNSAWIGLNNKDNHDLFKWSDGWRTSYINWGNEDNTQEEACAQLNITNGKWDAVHCDITLPYMCKFSTVQPPTPNPSGECPDKFQDIDSNSEYCYKISADGDLKSWGDAHSECFAYESTLASIHSEDSMNKMQAALQGKASDVWIGLQADVHGTWNWVDQTAFDYNNWQSGEPNFLDDFRYCAKVYEYGVGEDYVGKWDDTKCDTLYGYICERKRIPGPDTTTSIATKTTTPPTGPTTAPSNGMSSGAKAAVGICMLLLIAALVGGGVWFYFFMKQRNFEFNRLMSDFQRRSKVGKGDEANMTGFDNVAYVNNSEESTVHNDILDSA